MEHFSGKIKAYNVQKPSAKPGTGLECYTRLGEHFFAPHNKERCIIVGHQQCFIMAEKQEHSPARDFHNCSSKLVCPLSVVSIFIDLYRCLGAC